MKDVKSKVTGLKAKTTHSSGGKDLKAIVTGNKFSKSGNSMHSVKGDKPKLKANTHKMG